MAALNSLLFFAGSVGLLLLSDDDFFVFINYNGYFLLPPRVSFCSVPCSFTMYRNHHHLWHEWVGTHLHGHEANTQMRFAEVKSVRNNITYIYLPSPTFAFPILYCTPHSSNSLFPMYPVKRAARFVHQVPVSSFHERFLSLIFCVVCL